MGAVEFHGALVDAELGGDLYIEHAPQDEAQDYAFAIEEIYERLKQDGEVYPLAALRADSPSGGRIDTIS